MGAFIDLSNMNAALKELYSGQVVENLVYAHNPLLAMMPKFTEFGGKNKPIPIINGVTQGRSSNFANAQANQTALSIQEFFLTRKKDYSLATIDNETALASATDHMAFLNGSKIQIDGAFHAITLSQSSALFRSGTGSIGQITSIASGVITLTQSLDVTQFEIGQTLQANATDGGATPRAALGYVIAVNRAPPGTVGGGTVTVSTSQGGAAASPAAWAANDFLLVQGDLNAKISGLAAWLPQTPPTTGDNFYGVDRSIDTVRLAGLVYNGSAQSIEEALIDASTELGLNGGKPSDCVTNYRSFAALDKALGSKVQYIDHKGPAEISFKGIQIFGSNGVINVWPDRSCQAQTAYLLQMDTWCLESLGDAPQILTYGKEGLEMLRLNNSDAVELRVGYYANLRTNAPGWNSNVILGA